MAEQKAMKPGTPKRNEDVLSRMDPKLVHRVLLTDQSQFSSLTVSGKPVASSTPSYDDFSQRLQSESQGSVANTMKRAYRDHVCDFVLSARSMEPLHKLLLELHSMLRSLVPNRKDLHGMLRDEAVIQTTSPSEILPLLLEAGESLQQLESEVRSETTKEWIRTMQEYNTTEDAKEAITVIVTSMMYLLFKAELCDADKQDFYLANVWAPMIHSKGKEHEKTVFESRFGPVSASETAPLTRTWIKALVDEQSSDAKERLQVSSEARMNLIRVGWVEDILFRSADRQSLEIPEVLALDDVTIREIRDATRLAATGSALALHACNAAGVSPAVLNQPLQQSSPVELRRESLVVAMAGRSVPSQAAYEEAVTTAVVALAEEWNPSLGDGAREALLGRCRSVLRGEDPVIKLLDGRMKEASRRLILWKPQNVPSSIRSGIGSSDSNQQGSDIAKLFEEVANREFCRLGLSFYAKELATANWMAVKVIELAWDKFGKNLLDPIIRES